MLNSISETRFRYNEERINRRIHRRSTVHLKIGIKQYYYKSDNLAMDEISKIVATTRIPYSPKIPITSVQLFS